MFEKLSTTILLSALILFSLNTNAVGGDVRVWENNKGKKIKAEYVKFSEGKVYMKLTSGKAYEVNLEKLSKKDQQYVSSLLPKNKPKNNTVNTGLSSGDFVSFLKPLFAKSCVSCHGGPRPGKKPKVKGKINLFEIKTEKDLLNHPKAIKEMIEAIDANDMPPEDEPQLTAATKKGLITSLKSYLVKASKNQKNEHVQIHRLNRFQYNNAVKDLFQLNKDIFSLPEIFMTRRSGKDNYLNNIKSGKMPEKVNVENRSFDQKEAFKGVNPFPQDLRAAHGYDNQANNLSLSPLLLDSFLKLSMSIVQSPDFNQNTVGIWTEFFAEPKDKKNVATAVKSRLKKYLSRAFRRPVDEEVLTGYTNYTLSKIKSGMSFTGSMKKVVSVSLSSPLFLYKHGAVSAKENEFALASKLSFMLWGSSPDEELLALAQAGNLTKNLSSTVKRMMQDPKIERFLDTFPSQWMQLNAIIDAKPDPRQGLYFEYYWSDKNRPAGSQMVLEPLVLFDAVYMENRPIVELIKPSFTYRSKFLDKWYNLNTDKPTPQDIIMAKERHDLEKQRNQAHDYINKTRNKVKKTIHEALKKKLGKVHFANIEPHSNWDFNGNLNDSHNRIQLEAMGKVSFKDGMLILNNAYLQGDARVHFHERTYEIKFKLNSTSETGGGLFGIQDTKSNKELLYDTLVFSEKQAKHWLADSSGGARTKPFGGTAETKVGEMIHLVVAYNRDGSVEMYRNDKPYGKGFKAGKLQDYHQGKGTFFVGISDLTGQGKKLNVSIDSLRIYKRHIGGRDLKALSMGANFYIPRDDLVAKMDPKDQKLYPIKEKEFKELEDKIKKLPHRDHRKRRIMDSFRRDLRGQEFVRGPLNDPRYGGIITNAALMTMTSTSKRTRPIGRGAWIIEVILNDPPPPPPNDIPPLKEDGSTKNLTIRETFAKHRENPDCAGCHAKLDPLGFVMESFNPIGLWRDKYKKNNRVVDPHGTLLRKYDFKNVVDFKDALVKEEKRFAKAFTAHLLRFALSRELRPGDALAVEQIVNRAEKDKFKLQSLIKEVILSKSFLEK